MNRRVVVQAVVLVVAIVAGFTIGRLSRNDHTRELALARRAYDYCSAVHVALEQDARELNDPKDPARQQVAADRFMSEKAYHSELEILMCSQVPPNMEARDSCWLNRDYSCLAKVASAAAQSTRQ